MEETILRVVQALSIQKAFHYNLTDSNIKSLEDLGYQVTRINNDYFPWIWYCKVEKVEQENT